MSEENRLLIYEKYSEILDGILVYQDQQVDLREMCLKIMLGSFALVGGLLFVKIEISSQSLLIMSSIFPVLSLIIVTVNLVIDLFYKERLKLAFVSEALRLEKAHNWLPQFHVSLLKENKKKHSVADGQIVYYLGSAALLMLMSAISLSINPIFESALSKIIIFLAFCMIYFIYQSIFLSLLKKTHVILESI